MTGMGVRAFTYVVILLLVGIGIEWLYWSYAYAPFRAAQSAHRPPRRAKRCARPCAVSLLRWCGLFPSALAAIGARPHFPGRAACRSW